MSRLRQRAIDVSAESILSERSPAAARLRFVSAMSWPLRGRAERSARPRRSRVGMGQAHDRAEREEQCDEAGGPAEGWEGAAGDIEMGRLRERMSGGRPGEIRCGPHRRGRVACGLRRDGPGAARPARTVRLALVRGRESPLCAVRCGAVRWHPLPPIAMLMGPLRPAQLRRKLEMANDEKVRGSNGRSGGHGRRSTHSIRSQPRTSPGPWRPRR